MIDILHRYTRAVIFHSGTAQTIAEAVAEAWQNSAVLAGADLAGAVLAGADLAGAVLAGADLRDADLRDAVLAGAVLAGADLAGAVLAGADLAGAVLAGADLRDADLRDADLRGADLRGAHFSSTLCIASLCFGGWVVTVLPTETSIGCERHPNAVWLSWPADAPEIAAMHSDAAAWWTQHREAVCAVIRDVMGGKIDAA